jgi:hypothetical protein
LTPFGENGETFIQNLEALVHVDGQLSRQQRQTLHDLSEDETFLKFLGNLHPRFQSLVKYFPQESLVVEGKKTLARIILTGEGTCRIRDFLPFDISLFLQ